MAVENTFFIISFLIKGLFVYGIRLVSITFE